MDTDGAGSGWWLGGEAQITWVDIATYPGPLQYPEMDAPWSPRDLLSQVMTWKLGRPVTVQAAHEDLSGQVWVIDQMQIEWGDGDHE